MGGGARVLSGPAVLLTALLALATPAWPKEFGTYGKVFPIAEPDVLEEILSRFRAMAADGGLGKMEKDMQARTRAYLDRPRAAGFLPPATEYQAFTFDPSITINRDLADENGTVFARAGTTVNPLDYSIFDKRIVVIDGDAPAQVDYALEEGDELNTLIVITKGAPLDLMRRYGRRFWFDQDGAITGRFQIERLPTVITRADPLLLIEEIPVEEAQP